jgi:Family of unknown function (DUF7002)
MQFKAAHGHVFHATFAGGWDLIRSSELGLAPASALLDHYDYRDAEREALEERPRPQSVPLERAGLPTVWLRDQKPIAPPLRLADILLDGTTEEQ